MEPIIHEPLSQRIQLIVLLASLSLFFFIVHLVRQNYLKPGYAILWIMTALTLFLVSVFTDLLFWIATFAGIYYAPTALFIILFTGIILIMIHFSVIISRDQQQIKKLAQENALLQEKIERIYKNAKKK